MEAEVCTKGHYEFQSHIAIRHCLLFPVCDWLTSFPWQTLNAISLNFPSLPTLLRWYIKSACQNMGLHEKNLYGEEHCQQLHKQYKILHTSLSSQQHAIAVALLVYLVSSLLCESISQSLYSLARKPGRVLSMGIPAPFPALITMQQGQALVTSLTDSWQQSSGEQNSWINSPTLTEFSRLKDAV